MATKYQQQPSVFEDDRRPEAKEGEKYIVNKYCSSFELGQIIVLTDNDGSSCPCFQKDGNIGSEYCVSWHKLIPYNNSIDGQLAKIKKRVVLQGTYS